MGKWKTLSSNYVHENPYYKVRKDDVIRPDGKPGAYYVMEDGNSVFVIPRTDEGKILFVQLFRYPTQMDSWETPAGGADPGEDLLEAAKRELQEETGYRAKTWQDVGRIQISNSRTNSMGTVFVCHGLEKAGGDQQEEEGITNLTSFSWDEVMAMTGRGEITDTTTLGALMLAHAAGAIGA